MPHSDLPNEFQKYWHPELFRELPDWHENIIGIYHVSSIGCNHQDLEYNEHSGPCIRSTYWEYTDPLPDTDETIGNFEMGDDIHIKLQFIIKKWKPNTIIEKPLAIVLERDGKVILLVGSIDIEYKHLFNLLNATSQTKKKISIWDIKSASEYTLPKGKYDKNITHFDQTNIYGAMDTLFDLHPDYNEIIRLKIIYVNKHNKGTFCQRERFDLSNATNKLSDCIDRAFYLHACLETSQLPVPEPQKWCKYCKYLTRCIDQGDVEPIMKGKKNPKLVGLKVIEVEI